MRSKIGIIGPLNIDMVIRGTAPQNIEELVKWGGLSDINILLAGAVGYFSQNISKLGFDAHLVSTIADDLFGEMILSILKKQNIKSDYINIEKSKQGAIAVYMLLFGSNKRPITFRLPTHHGWPPKFDKNIEEYLLDTDIIHCGGYLHFKDLWNNDVPEIFKKAKQKGIITSLDPQFPLEPLNPPWSKVLDPLLKFTDILFLDENESLGVTNTKNIDEATPILADLGPKIVVVKLGAEGSIILHDKKIYRQKAIPPKILVDSIGAGDSFDAGFLYAISKKYPVTIASKIASYVASKSCEGIGGTNTFPTEEEIPKEILE